MDNGLTKLPYHQALSFRFLRLSLRVSLSSSSSKTIFFNRSFYFSRERNSNDCYLPMPPNRFCQLQQVVSLTPTLRHADWTSLPFARFNPISRSKFSTSSSE